MVNALLSEALSGNALVFPYAADDFTREDFDSYCKNRRTHAVINIRMALQKLRQ